MVLEDEPENQSNFYVNIKTHQRFLVLSWLIWTRITIIGV